MKKYDVMIIGHISEDHEIDCHGNELTAIGGAVTYAAASASAVSPGKVAVLTKTAEKDRGRMTGALRVGQEDIFWIPSRANSTMYNRFLSEDKERRNSFAGTVADPFAPADIPENVPEVYDLAGLVSTDFDPELFPYLSGRAKLAVDVQGVMRAAEEKDAEGFHPLVYHPWKNYEDFLPMISYLKLDAREAEFMTGLSDRREAAKVLFDKGAKEILITYNTEVLVYDGKNFYTYPLRPRSLTGRPGRGDTTFGAYVTKRCSAGIGESLSFAASLVSLKMEKLGPFTLGAEDVEAFRKERYQEDDLKIG